MAVNVKAPIEWGPFPIYEIFILILYCKICNEVMKFRGQIIHDFLNNGIIMFSSYFDEVCG